MKSKYLIGIFLSAVLLTTLTGDAGESSSEAIEPGIGQRAPAFTLKDQNGKEASLDELLKKGPVALVFVRSADWCLYCELQLIQLQRNLKDIESSGGQVVGISYDSTKKLKRFSDRQQITFPLLSDVGSKTIDAYGMRNKQAKDGSSVHGTIIIDRQGVVRARLPLISYDDKPAVDALVKALREACAVNGGTKQ